MGCLKTNSYPRGIKRTENDMDQGPNTLYGGVYYTSAREHFPQSVFAWTNHGVIGGEGCGGQRKGGGMRKKNAAEEKQKEGKKTRKITGSLHITPTLSTDFFFPFW